MSRLYSADPWASFESIITERLELEAIKFSSRLNIDRRVLMDRTNVRLAREIDRFAVDVMHYVYGLRAEAEETVSYPATWWDAFKLRFFPRWGRLGRWAAKRWPAKHTHVKVKFKAQALFPQLEARGLRNQHIVYRTEVER